MSIRAFIIGAVIVALAQTVALGAMIFQRAMALQSGREIVVQSGFVDPRDLFRGHYVLLNIVVGDLNRDHISVDRPFERDEPVYVRLAADPESGFWRASALAHELPADSTDAYLRGKILYVPEAADESYRIGFPFDRYFADRERAKELEKLRQDQRLGVVLVLGDDGSGYIKGLTIDGRRVYDEPLL
jgi:uncharacterized membrane-anchored protein